MFDKLIYKLCLLRNKIISKDDFSWEKYHKNYQNQIEKSEEDHTLKISNDDFETREGKIYFKCNPPMYENHELLYQIIYDLNPATIFEIGCGNGDHIYNLSKILPSSSIIGCDLLPKQLEFLKERNPEISSKVFLEDITSNDIGKLPESDLIYTQAVIMHIQKKDTHKNALRNILKNMKDYIVLMENWKRHNFYEDIKKISSELKLKIHLYKIDNGKQIAMVISKIPLNGKLNYEQLNSDEELVKYFK